MTSSSFIHPKAIVEPGAQIGPGTKVWVFVHVLPGAVIGADCNLNNHIFIENQVRIGDRVTIKCGVQIWDGVTIEDDVFVGPNATFTNDPFPRSKEHLKTYPPTRICKGATIGANATLLPGITVGVNALVGAGAVITRDVPPHAIVVGNPAWIKGYVASEDRKETLKSHPVLTSRKTLAVQRVNIIKLPLITDLRGDLTYGEYDQHLPFAPKRFFVIHNVPTLAVRGEHAHKEQHQVLVCLQGACSVVVDDGVHRDEIILNTPEIGLHIPSMVWATQYKYSADAILLVLASDIYNADEYIRDYDQFLDQVSKT